MGEWRDSVVAVDVRAEIQDGADERAEGDAEAGAEEALPSSDHAGDSTRAVYNEL